MTHGSVVDQQSYSTITRVLEIQLMDVIVDGVMRKGLMGGRFYCKHAKLKKIENEKT
jgi:hypothetical protein